MPLALEAIAVRPSVLHPDSGERMSDEMKTIGAITYETLNARVIRRGAGIFDVVDAETKPLQPDQMVDELPGNTSQRKLAE